MLRELLLPLQALFAEHFRLVNRVLLPGLIFLRRNWSLDSLICEAFKTRFRVLAIRALLYEHGRTTAIIRISSH